MDDYSRSSRSSGAPRGHREFRDGVEIVTVEPRGSYARSSTYAPSNAYAESIATPPPSYHTDPPSVADYRSHPSGPSAPPSYRTAPSVASYQSGMSGSTVRPGDGSQSYRSGSQSYGDGSRADFDPGVSEGNARVAAWAAETSAAQSDRSHRGTHGKRPVTTLPVDRNLEVARYANGSMAAVSREAKNGGRKKSMPTGDMNVVRHKDGSLTVAKKHSAKRR